MSVRVVARIRPLLKNELDKDTIVEAASATSEPLASTTIVRIPNPKNEAEAYSFQFNSVYDQEATQQQLFDDEGKTILRYGPRRVLTLLRSVANRKASFQRLRCHSLCLWRYRNWKDTHNARRQGIGRTRRHPAIAQQHLPPKPQNRKGLGW